ncbi:hypothetical protein [Microbaculum marinum]|uniref:Uncharacterized protein n=1 Tax=Microbaculum marinum TaxID=1764581 RepID=A0AAW9REM3_9HYPH
MTDLLRILISPVVWLAAFSAVYGLHGVLCEISIDGTGYSRAWARPMLVGAFALALLVQMGLLALLYSTSFQARPGFARTVSRTSGWVGLVATIWTLFPTLAVTACG